MEHNRCMINIYVRVTDVKIGIIYINAQDLSTDIKSGVSDSPSSLVDDADTDPSLLGCVVCDVYQEREQLEALIHASQSSSVLGFDKVILRSWRQSVVLDIHANEFSTRIVF